MQGSGNRQGKARNGGEEIIALIRMHGVIALHGADRRRYHRAAGVAKRLAGLKVRMLADNAIASDFLNFAVGIGNQPMPLKQLSRYFAGVGDRDGVGEHITILIGGRLRFDEMRSRFNYYFVFFVHY